MKFLLPTSSMILLTTSVAAEPCNFDQMDLLYYKDDKCNEIDYTRTRRHMYKYGQIQNDVEGCICDAEAAKCSKISCTADAIFFYDYSIQDRKCKGEKTVAQSYKFNKCESAFLGFSTLHYKDAIGYVDPGFESEVLLKINHAQDYPPTASQ